MTPCKARPTPLLPEFWTVGKVDALKSRLLGALQSTDIAVQSCGGLSDTTRAEWGVFFGPAMQWAQSDTSIWLLGSQADRGQGYEDELFCRQQDIAASCAVPIFDPVNQPALDPQGPIGQTLKWLTIAGAVVAGAYVVSKVSEVALDALKLAPHKS